MAKTFDRTHWDVHIYRGIVGRCYTDANTPLSTSAGHSTVFRI